MSDRNENGKPCVIMRPVLSVLYSQDCQSFNCFLKLKDIFASFGPVLEISVESLAIPLRPSETQNLSRCKGGAVIITKGFLRFLEKNHDLGYQIANCLRPQTTAAFFIGVTEWDIQSSHKIILVSYHVWQRFVIQEGDSIPSEVVSVIRDIFFGRDLNTTIQEKENKESLPALEKTEEIQRKIETIKNTSEGKNFGPPENTVETKDNNTAVKSTESLQALNKADEIKQGEDRIKNTSEERNERCPTEERGGELETKDLLQNNTPKISEMEEDIQKETIAENVDSVDVPVKNDKDNTEDEKAVSRIQFRRKAVIKRVINRSTISNGALPQKNEKDMSEKDTEPYGLQKRKDDIQLNNNTKEMDILEKTKMESEKTSDIQEITENTELPESLEKTVDPEKKTSKDTDKLKNTALKKSKTVIKVNEEPVKGTNGMSINHNGCLQPLNEVGRSKAEVENGSDLSPKDGIQEKGDFQVQEIKMSSKTSRKMEDMKKMTSENEESSKTSDKADDSGKRKLRRPEPLKEMSIKKKKKKRASKTLELLENKDGVSANDSESCVMLRTTEDAQEATKRMRKSLMFQRMNAVQLWDENEDTVAVMPEIKMENPEEVRLRNIMVPQAVDKNNDCVFLIFTTLLSNLENVYVLLERNILKETPIHQLNPYVVFFFVPEQFLDVQGTVNVHIRYENRLLDVKSLCIMPTPQASRCARLVSEATSPLEWASVQTLPELRDDVTLIQTDTDEDHPQDCSDFSKTDENESAEGNLPSLWEFVAQYGFGDMNELALGLMDERDIQEPCGKSPEGNLFTSSNEWSESVTFRESTSQKKETLQRASLEFPKATVSLEETTPDFRRSSSLPLLSNINLPGKDCESGAAADGVMCMDDGTYMEMGRPGKKLPHQIFLEELLQGEDSEDSSQLNSLSSSIYVSMALSLEHDEAEEIILSESQQELLMLLTAFKTKDKTLSEVESEFNDWLKAHRDSVDSRGVAFPISDDDTLRKGKKPQSSLTDLMRVIARIPGKKSKKEDKAQQQEAKTIQKTDKRRERNIKTQSKISNSSVSSACSLASDTGQTVSPGNQEGKRDSGNHSDCNEDNKRKTLTEDEKSTKWFIIPPSTCLISDEGTPPSLPSRPPPSAYNSLERRPNLPTRLPPRLRNWQDKPPVLPPKPSTLLKVASSSVTDHGSKKKNKSKDTPLKTKKYQRDASPDYITATNHPRSPPKTRDQFKQAIHPTPSQRRRNNYALERLKLTADHARKTSAPDMRSRSNSPRYNPNTPPTPPISRLAALPLTTQKDHHNRYNKPLVPYSRRSTSCPDLQANTTGERVHTYMELQRDPDHNQNASYLHSNKTQGSKSPDPPRLPPK